MVYPPLGRYVTVPSALNVCDDWVSATVLLLEVHVADLDEPLDLVSKVYISGNGD